MDLNNILSKVDHTLLLQPSTWEEIKTICDCGAKATVNARMDDNGKVVTAGDQICLGGNDRYIAMCHKCWKKAIAEHK